MVFAQFDYSCLSKCFLHWVNNNNWKNVISCNPLLCIWQRETDWTNVSTEIQAKISKWILSDFAFQHSFWFTQFFFSLFLWTSFNLWVPSVCHNNRNYRLRLRGTTHTVAFRRKLPTKWLKTTPLKNKIQEIWWKIVICNFFIVISLIYSKDDTVFQMSLYEKANLEVFAKEPKIFMHAHVLSAGSCTGQANRVSLYFIWRKVQLH